VNPGKHCGDAAEKHADGRAARRSVGCIAGYDGAQPRFHRLKEGPRFPQDRPMSGYSINRRRSFE
jgi:hypothetical protein